MNLNNHPIYEPEKWNKDINIKKTHNCYAYALNLIDKEQVYDIEVSNPPYLSKIAYEKISQEMKLFEPRISLKGGSDGLIFYRKIVILFSVFYNIRHITFLISM